MVRSRRRSPCGRASQEHEELGPHADLRRELFKRSIQVAADDPRPWIPAEEVRKHLLELRNEPRQEPARWKKAVPAPTHRGFVSGGPPVTTAQFESAFPPGRSRLPPRSALNLAAASIGKTGVATAATVAPAGPLVSSLAVGSAAGGMQGAPLAAWARQLPQYRAAP